MGIPVVVVHTSCLCSGKPATCAFTWRLCYCCGARRSGPATTTADPATTTAALFSLQNCGIALRLCDSREAPKLFLARHTTKGAGHMRWSSFPSSGTIPPERDVVDFVNNGGHNVMHSCLTISSLFVKNAIGPLGAVLAFVAGETRRFEQHA